MRDNAISSSSGGRRQFIQFPHCQGKPGNQDEVACLDVQGERVTGTTAEKGLFSKNSKGGERGGTLEKEVRRVSYSLSLEDGS